MTTLGRGFWCAFLALAAVKAALACWLPLFGDEAWYWLEGRHLAWAYSDLPGLTAWLIRLGTGLFGDTTFGVRVSFLVLSMGLPLLVRATAAAWFGEAIGRRAAWLALLMPLLGGLGFLALPDVPMTVAAAMCLYALRHASLRGGDAVLLALGLVIGALSHYRFALIVVAGFAGVLLANRALLRSRALWVAVAVGALAWLPLLAWNLAHHNAGLAFQLAERHPWSLHAGGGWFLPVQLAIASPLLAIACALALWHAWSRWRAGDKLPVHDTPWGVVLGAAGVPLLVYGVLAFVADRERVSFHWTLQAYLPLLGVAPLVLARWSRVLRIATYLVAATGLLVLLGYAGVAASPALRERLSQSRWYPDNFAGWNEIAAATRDLDDLAADNFMLGAQLAFARGDAGLPILDHPLNRKHGRAVQLALWGQGERDARWLVVEDSAVPMRDRLSHYQAMCERLGDYAITRVIDVDRGRKRFLVLDRASKSATCRVPALAWIDAPSRGAVVDRRFDVSGWAFKDGAGIARVEITLDGAVIATANYGEARPHIAPYWRTSSDAAHPNVGYSARIDAAPGEHWLGLVLHGKDGSVEPWPPQRIVVE